MKRCWRCNAILEDTNEICPFCGNYVGKENLYYSKQQYNTQTSDNPFFIPGDIGGTMGNNNSFDKIHKYEEPYENMNYSYGANSYNMSENGYGFNQLNSGKTEQKNQQKTMKKNKGKKKTIIGLVCLSLFLVIAIIFIILFGKNIIIKHKIKERTNEYKRCLENLDGKGIIELTAPEKLIENIYIDMWSLEGDSMTNISDKRDEFEEEYDYIVNNYMDEFELSRYDIQLEINRFKINDIEKFNIEEIFDNTISTYKRIDQDNDFSYEKKMYSLYKAELEKYDINLEDFYKVDISLDFALTIDGRVMTTDEIRETCKTDFWIDFDKAIDHVYAYKYNGEYYILPAIEECVFYPAVKQYEERYNHSKDISMADTIRTNIETAMSSEECYKDIEEAGLFDKIIIISEEELRHIPSKLQDELGFNKELPEPKYKADEGFDHFAIRMNSGYNPPVVVYITDGDEYLEISPYTDQY
ncbi:zinc ribbon domain-containing protein [Clostridium sp. AF15-31]|nr:zinc ribbon domain-containing protein [Clostridium sp. AF15-31]